MPTDPEQTLDPEDIDYCAYNWSDLPWSGWVPFTADKYGFKKITKEPGIYRIRPVGRDFLMYVGETKRSVHQRLQDLRVELGGADRMPWADPHTEAPALWTWQQAEGFEYECSAAPLDASANGRRGMECYLLYRYRQERGESPLCNFGRFHPRYRRSTSRKENVRGGRLEDGHKDNPAGGPSFPPLPAAGEPGESDWMGISWSRPESLVPENLTEVPAGQGLYLLIDAESDAVISIGQSAVCAQRLLDQSKKSWDKTRILFSVHGIEKPVSLHQRREMENDLIGNFFERFQKAPEFQFRNSS